MTELFGPAGSSTKTSSTGRRLPSTATGERCATARRKPVDEAIPGARSDPYVRRAVFGELVLVTYVIDALVAVTLTDVTWAG
jgi:hypothetical protein